MLTITALPVVDPLSKERLSNWLSILIPAGIVAMVLSLTVLGNGITSLLLLLLIPLLLVVLAFTNTERAIFFFIVYCAVEGLFKTMTHYSSIVHVGRDLVLGVIICGALTQHMLRGRPARQWPKDTLLVVVFAVACTVQIANPYGLGLTASVAALRMHLGAVPLFFLGYFALTGHGQVKRFMVLTGAIGVALAAVALLQQYMGFGWTSRVFPGTADYVHSATYFLTGAGQFWRPPSTTSDGGGASTWVQVAAPAWLILFWIIHRWRYLAWAAIPVGLIVMIGGLVVSSVRAMALIGLLEVIVCLLLLAKNREVMRAAPMVLLTLGLMMVSWQAFEVQSNVVSRRFDVIVDPLAAYQAQRAHNLAAIPEDISKIPFGAGLGRTGAAAAEFSDEVAAQPVPGFETGYMNSETYFAGMLAETGIPGALLITVISAVFLVRSFTLTRRVTDTDQRACAIAMFAILLGIVVSYFSGPSLYQPPLSIYFWLCAGVVARMQDQLAPVDSLAAPRIGPRPIAPAVV